MASNIHSFPWGENIISSCVILDGHDFKKFLTCGFLFLCLRFVEYMKKMI